MRYPFRSNLSSAPAPAGRALLVAAFLAPLLSWSVNAQATPLRLDYVVSDLGGGSYGYDFTLTLDNNDASWAASQGFGWVVFGDCTPSCTSPLTGWAGTSVDPPWLSFATTSGLHNGPTLSLTSAFYTPTFVGETRTWSGTSTADLHQGFLHWSNLTAQNGGAFADNVVANRLNENCGNGVIDAGEDCDDSNFADGDCCSSTCQYDADGAACTDANVCDDDVCDGAGTCEHTNNTASCEDGEFCTTNDVCSGGVCLGGTPTCDDDNACTIDTCDEGADTCDNEGVPVDPGSCFAAPKGKFQIKDSLAGVKDKLQFQWSGGAAFAQTALGTPTTSTTYTLCVYDNLLSVPSLKVSVKVAASSLKWTDKDPKGIVYKDKFGASDGATKVQVKTGEDGKTRVKFQAGGLPLSLPLAASPKYFHQSPSVIVQLVNSIGACWSSEFLDSQAKKNTTRLFLSSK